MRDARQLFILNSFLINAFVLSNSLDQNYFSRRRNRPVERNDGAKKFIREDAVRARRRSLNEKLLSLATVYTPELSEENQNPDFLNVDLDRSLADGGDDLFYGYGYDIENYSLKYIKCATIATWDEDLIADQDSETVVRPKSFAVFRLCPANSCNSNARWGCGGSFGDYIIELDTYLLAIHEYKEEYLQNYCAYCRGCAQNAAAADDAVVNDAAVDDAIVNDAAADDAVVNDAAADDAVNDAAEADDGFDDDKDCSMCSKYDKKCVDYYNAGEDYEQFLECQLFEGTNAKQLYLGPHCSSDGRTIVIGTYADEDCTRYVMDVDIDYFTGMKLSSKTLSNRYGNDCVRCDGKDFLGEGNGNDNDKFLILDFCNDLYLGSGKCNKKLGSQYATKNDKLNEENVCSFISNVANNKYDETGTIKLFTFDFSDVAYLYGNLKGASFTGGQSTTLTILIVLIVLLVIWSWFLRRALDKMSSGDDDSQYRGGNYQGAPIEWKESGIGAGRSGTDDDSNYALPKEFR